MRMRVLVLLLVLVFACAAPQAARAQAAPAQIEVRVVDRDGKPIDNARVFISGAVLTSALTPADGKLRFDDVEPGIYVLRVERTGYDAVSVGEVEALAGRRRVVDVTLSKPVPKPAANGIDARSGLQEIGRVSARPAVVVTSVDVDEGDPLRRVSENLVDALDKVAGVAVDTSNASGTLTISLRNADPSRTIATAGGSPLLGGGAPQLQQIAGDLAAGASVDSGRDFGGVGGSVNFRTLEPTKTWQGTLSAGYGTYEHSYATFSLSGGVKKLGIAVQHGVRGADDILTGLTFRDTSGFTYAHDGAYARDGDFVKLRYAMTPQTRFDLSVLSGSNAGSPICHDFVTEEPCGYGPDNATGGHAHNVDFRVQSQIGRISFSAGGNVSAYGSIVDDSHLTVAGVAEPFFSTTTGAGKGFYTYTSLPAARHTFALALGSFGGLNRTVASGAFQQPRITPYRFGWLSLIDTDKLSDHWELEFAGGTSTSLTGTNGQVGFGATLHASRLETLAVLEEIGGSNGGFNYGAGPFGDPAQGTYNCGTDAVRVTGPNESPKPASTSNLEITYDKRGRRGTVRINAYDRLERGSQLQAQFPLNSLGPQIPAGYLNAIDAIWQQPAICGSEPFDPARVYVAEALAGEAARYRGVDAQGSLVLGRETIAQTNYSISGATLASNDPRLLITGSPYVLGGQLPFKPLHRAGLTIDVRQPKAKLEWLINGQWTSANNTYALTSYVVANAGVSWRAQRGAFTVVASNLFNADSGLFAGREFAQPLSLVGGGTYLPVPTLLAPRSFTLIYTVRAGRQH